MFKICVLKDLMNQNAAKISAGKHKNHEKAEYSWKAWPCQVMKNLFYHGSKYVTFDYFQSFVTIKQN